MQITASPKQLERILRFNIPRRRPTLIVGSPGTGKSDMVDGVRTELDYNLVLGHAVTDDPLDYKGLGGFTSPGRADFTPFGDLLELIETEQNTLCFLDDLGQAPTAVQAAVMQLILARRVNGKIISDKVVFAAATNKREDKSGVQSLIQALMSRADIIHLKPDINDWVSWALKTDLPLPLIAACRLMPQWIEDWSPSKDIENSPCPRNVYEVGKIMLAKPDKDIEHILFASRLGDAAAIQLQGYLATYKDLPTIDEILMSPQTARLPKDPASKFVIAEALVKRTNKQCVDNVFEYMDRIDKEYQALYVKGLSTNNVEMTETKAFISWANDNQGIIL